MGRKPTYSQEFKDGAVRLSLEEGKTVRVVEMRSELAVDANVRHRPILLSADPRYAD